MAAASDFVQALLSQEIRRIVSRAAKSGAILSTSDAAREVRKVYPGCGLSEREIGDQVMMAAARAGVAVELDRSRAA
jgi:hypothetical protein